MAAAMTLSGTLGVMDATPVLGVAMIFLATAGISLNWQWRLRGGARPGAACPWGASQTRTAPWVFGRPPGVPLSWTFRSTGNGRRRQDAKEFP